MENEFLELLSGTEKGVEPGSEAGFLVLLNGKRASGARLLSVTVKRGCGEMATPASIGWFPESCFHYFRALLSALLSEKH